MHQNRQVFKRGKYINREKEVNQEYGIIRSQKNKNKIQLRQKSKSQKDILIAKNKKLPLFFNKCNDSNDLKTKIKPYGLKLNRVNKYKSENPFIILENEKQSYGQYGFQSQPTSYFQEIHVFKKGVPQRQKQYEKELKISTFLLKNNEQNIKLRQRLKKSQSMRDLIQQRYLAQEQKGKETLRKRLDQQNEYQPKNQKRNEQDKKYDSSKYNWRLSMSKQKETSKSHQKLNLMYGSMKSQKGKKQSLKMVQSNLNNERKPLSLTQAKLSSQVFHGIKQPNQQQNKQNRFYQRNQFEQKQFEANKCKDNCEQKDALKISQDLKQRIIDQKSLMFTFGSDYMPTDLNFQ